MTTFAETFTENGQFVLGQVAKSLESLEILFDKFNYAEGKDEQEEALLHDLATVINRARTNVEVTLENLEQMFDKHFTEPWDGETV